MSKPTQPTNSIDSELEEIVEVLLPRVGEVEGMTEEIRQKAKNIATTQIETLITEGRLIELDLLEQAINQDLDMYKFKMMRLEALQASLKGTSNAGKA